MSDIHSPHSTSMPKGLYKFLMLLGVLVVYFGYLSWKYDLATGGIVSALTWSFFVLCTPIADAGFLIDFPVRLITGLKMFFTELLVWILAISINVLTLMIAPDSYDTTFLTSLLHKILINPWPYWSIILLCAAGTFLSIHFGDELFDAVLHKRKEKALPKGFKHRIILMLLLFAAIIPAYYLLLQDLHLNIP